ncbi:MAG: hypothetical protein QXJ51_00910 [Sulfolobales archaeon]
MKWYFIFVTLIVDMMNMGRISRRDISKIMTLEKIDLRIGFKGISEGLKKEIKRRIDEKGFMKVKILKNARDKVREEDIERLAEDIGCKVASRRGYVFLLVRKDLISRSRSSSTSS